MQLGEKSILMKNEINFLNHLYKEIAKPIENSQLNIFLCGENPQFSDGKVTMRSLIDNEISNQKNCFIVYPEWLFNELLSRDKNLLELENRLVSMVDSVVIPLSTYSTFTELGSFTGNKDLLKKVIVINDIEYKHKNSFVNVGPIKLIQKKVSRQNVIFYQDFKNEVEEISKKIISRTKIMIKENKRSTNNLFSLSSFIQLIILLFQPIDKRKLKSYLRERDEYDLVHDFDPAIRILLEKKLIICETKQVNTKKLTYYQLSETGHNELIEKRLDANHLKDKYYSIRAETIRNKYSRRYDISVLGKKRFLEDFNIEIR